MSASLDSSPGQGLGLWVRQVLAIHRLELRKNLLGRWALPMYFLAALPVLLMLIWAIVPVFIEVGDDEGMGESSTFYSGVFQTFMLRFVIFFGCVGVFTNLFRGEVVDRSLHYYLLSPLRREVLAAGKYLSGVTATVLIFTSMTVLSYLLLYLRDPGSVGSYLLGGPGLGHLVAYAAMTVLACVGYGAVFLAMGLLFRNPVIPAVFVFGWESVNVLLPATLKKISVIHYLYSMAPVPLDVGPFALIAEPTSPWISIPGLILVCAVLLLASALFVRRMEIRYGND